MINIFQRSFQYFKPFQYSQQIHNLSSSSLLVTNIRESNRIISTDLYYALLSNNNNYLCSPLIINYTLSLLHNTNRQLSNVFIKKYTHMELLAINLLFNDDIAKMENFTIINNNFRLSRKYFHFIRNFTHVSSDHFINDRMAMVFKSNLDVRAQWNTNFDPEKTSKQKFGVDKVVDMMTITGFFNYFEDEFAQRLEIPYKNGQYCMGFILRKSLFFTNGKTMFTVPPHSKKYEVEVHIPKFKLDTFINLIPILKEIGIINIFNPDLSILTYINNNIDLYVSGYISKTKIAIDEYGVRINENNLIINDSSNKKSTSLQRKSKPIIFRADRPFDYYIKHVTGPILYIGHYVG